jgi:hypothetical protein
MNLRAHSLFSIYYFWILRFSIYNTFRLIIKITLPQKYKKYHSTQIDFVENQLSQSLISLSPLTTIHPRILQHARVRSSNLKRFSTWSWLDHFASGINKVTKIFSVRHFKKNKLATLINLLVHYAKGTLKLLTSIEIRIKFQILLNAFIKALFTFLSQY